MTRSKLEFARRLFQGSTTALVTPFTKEGALDEKALEKLLHLQLESKTKGFVIGGTTGEAPTLSREELDRCVRVTQEQAAGRATITVGVGTYNTKESVERARWAKSAGADALLVVNPYYNKPSQAGCVAHIQEIAKVGVPILLYNHPGRTNVDLSIETLKSLSVLDEVIAVKECSGNVTKASDIVDLGAIALLCGDDPLALPYLHLGGIGTVSVISNVIPHEWARIHEDFFAGRLVQAAALFRKYRHLSALVCAECNPAGIKYALFLQKCCEITLRLPLVPPGTKNQNDIQQEMERSGLLTGMCSV